MCPVPIFLKSENVSGPIFLYPVTAGHLLIIPKRHEPSWFELSQGELAQCNLLLKQMKEQIMDEDGDVQGFNVGVNAGAVAGQTVMGNFIELATST
jgi:ATP adenylyltransferase